MKHYEPIELVEEVESQWELLSDKEIMTNREHRRKQEMWCAGKFALIYSQNLGKCAVLMNPEEDFEHIDFKLVVDGEELPFQLAEVMNPDRRRDYEYKNLTDEEISEKSGATTRYSAHEGSELLRLAVEKKLSNSRIGPISSSLHLLLYANIGVSELPWATMRNAMEPAAKQFASVWVTTGQMICCIWGGLNWHGETRWRAIRI